MNNVEIVQVEKTKLLGVTLDCKLFGATVAKMRRGMSILKCCSTFLTTISTRQVLQTLEGLGKITTGPEHGSTAGP